MKTVAQQPLQNKPALMQPRYNCSLECEAVTRSQPAIRDPVSSYTTQPRLPVCVFSTVSRVGIPQLSPIPTMKTFRCENRKLNVSPEPLSLALSFHRVLCCPGHLLPPAVRQSRQNSPESPPTRPFHSPMAFSYSH